MKVAIPTNDGIHIAIPGQTTGGYHIFTLEGKEIAGEELRWSKPTSNGEARENPWKLISDCAVVLVPDGTSPVSGDSGIQTVRVRESIITRIIWDYVSETARREANTCCCP
jgi:hypothetical protein